MRKLIPFLGLLFIVILACNSSDQTNQDTAATYSIEIADSLQIDYLGDFWIMDYDPQSEQFVSLTKNDQEVLVIDQKGKIKSSFVIPSEGPGAISGIFLVSMNNGKVEVFDSRNGFFVLSQKGEILKLTRIPYQYIYINQGSSDAYFSLGKGIAYMRPEYYDSLGHFGGFKGMVKEIYRKPLMEILDTINNQTKPIMTIPKESIYADGNYYFIPFTSVTNFNEMWYLNFTKELRFFVYEMKNQDLTLGKSVNLQVKDAVLPLGISFDQAENYMELSKGTMPGTILQLYRMDELVIVIYQKGVSQELIFTNNLLPEPQDLNSINKTYAAVFDTNHELIQNDILVPSGLIFSRAITKDGEILAKKNQDYFETEEDQVIYYKLKLVELND
ncbi:MAG: hypothetical protein ACI9O5_000183 [Algoriphagus sp.]|jgi:hypothetical protein